MVEGPLLIVALALLCRGPQRVEAGAGCSMQNYCNGHGLCRNTYSQCDCYAGWGAASDIAVYKAPDCSLRESKSNFTACNRAFPRPNNVAFAIHQVYVPRAVRGVMYPQALPRRTP